MMPDDYPACLYKPYSDPEEAPTEPAALAEGESPADFGVDPVMGPLYHIVVEVASALDVFAAGIDYADGSDPSVYVEMRDAWDGIMARMGRIEQLLAALPLPERGADADE